MLFQPVEKPKRKSFWPLERLWAYVTVKQLLDENDSNPEKAKDSNGPAKKALDIALKVSQYIIYTNNFILY